MAQLLVRNIEESVKSLLKERAKRHGHSMEEEIRMILRESVQKKTSEDMPLGTKLASYFKDLDFDFEIPELPFEAPRPAVFTEDDFDSEPHQAFVKKSKEKE